MRPRGAIAGGVVGGVAALALIGGGVYWYRRKRAAPSRRKSMQADGIRITTATKKGSSVTLSFTPTKPGAPPGVPDVDVINVPVEVAKDDDV